MAGGLARIISNSSLYLITSSVNYGVLQTHLSMIELTKSWTAMPYHGQAPPPPPLHITIWQWCAVEGRLGDVDTDRTTGP